MTKEEIDSIEEKIKILEKHHVPELNGKIKTTGDRVGVYAAIAAMEEYAQSLLSERDKRIAELEAEIESFKKAINGFIASLPTK